MWVNGERVSETVGEGNCGLMAHTMMVIGEITLPQDRVD